MSISVLVVEDNPDKRQRIFETLVHACGSSNCEISLASSYIGACELLESRVFDLLILDLLIPRTENENPDANLSVSLLKSFQRSSPHFKVPRYIVGLTAFEDAKERFDSVFASSCWTLLQYDQSQLEWQEHLATFAEHVLRQASPPSQAAPDVVILLHGIRDYGPWQSKVKRILENGTCIRVFTIKYGWFGPLRFVAPRVPWDFTKAPLARLEEEYRNVKHQYEDAKVSVIAHSFGTYLLTRFLVENPHARLHRIILCGSVIRQDFPWSRVASQIGDPSVPAKDCFIINDCGDGDKWPTMARSVGYGDIGTNGAGSALVTDRFHSGSHGLFMDERFVDRYWKPFIESGEIVPSETLSRGRLSKSLLPFELFPAWIIGAAIITLAIYLTGSGIFFWVAIAAIAAWAIWFLAT